MKKSKLIATLCTLVLTLACLTFGVYSAVKTSFTASGTITFNAYGINLDLEMSFAGTDDPIATKYLSTHTSRSEHLTSGQTYTDISAGVTGLALAFEELEIPTGKTEPEHKITITMKVKNYSGYPIMANPTLKFGAKDSETAALFESTFTNSIVNGIKNLADAATAELIITISPKGTSAITSNNNFKFEIELVPYDATTLNANEVAYWTTVKGYDLADTNGFTIVGDTINSYTGPSVEKIIIPRIDGVTKIEGTTTSAAPITSGTQETTTYAGAPAGEPQSMFYNLRSSIKEIVMFDNITTIGQNAFCGLYELKTITIPNSVKSIGEKAFEGCGEFTIVFLGTIPEWKNMSRASKWTDAPSKITVICLEGELLGNA